MNRTISLALGAALLGSVLVGPAAAKPAAPHPTSAFAFVTADTPVPGTITSVDIMASGLKKRYAPADQATTLTVTAPNNNGFVASFVSDAITVRVPAVDGTYTMIFA
ncbi:MAG: hypothetical protein ACXWFU_10080, partial [Actinomycetota bacterium]